MEKNKLNWQSYTDRITEKIFLWAIPQSVKPNQITFLRFLTVPIIYFMVKSDFFIWGFILFMFSASTDFIDGAMARTRNQVTDLGKIIDPLADKALIGTILFALGSQYFIVKIVFIFICIEFASTLLGVLLRKKIGKSEGANNYGKIKMILQSIAVLILILGIILNYGYLIDLAMVILFGAIFFAILSAYSHFNRTINQIMKKNKFTSI